MCTINEDNMMHGSWDIKCNRQSSLSVWAIFALRRSYQPEKSKFWKNEKKPGDIIILHLCTKMTIIWCMVPEIKSMTDRIFFLILDHFLPFYPLNNPENQNLEKIKKTPGDIIILHKCTKNHDMLYCSWDFVHDK